MSRTRLACVMLLLANVLTVSAAANDPDGFKVLFPRDGVPSNWRVSAWSNVKDPPPAGASWEVREGVLHGSTPRGTWLVSEREYSDFELQFDFRLGEQGNSGVGLRFPAEGDPAFDGLELQIVDPRYYGGQPVPQSELTGSLYKAIAPARQVYKPAEWNRYEITCRGSNIKVVLNGETIQQVDLNKETQKPERGVPLNKRPRRGFIGFQELSRGGGHIEIRAARIKEFAPN